MEWMESSITFGRHHRKQKEKEEESKTCTSVVWFASTRPIRCRSPPPPSRCRRGSGPPAAAEAAAAAAAARRLRQRGRRRLHRGRPWHRAPSGEKADPRKVAYTLAFVVSFDVGRICTTQTHEGELLQHFCQLGGLIFKDGQCLWPTPVDYCALRLGLQQTFVCTYLYMYVASQSSSSLYLLSLSLCLHCCDPRSTASPSSSHHVFEEVLHCRTGYSAPRNCSSPCLPTLQAIEHIPFGCPPLRDRLCVAVTIMF